MTLTCGDLTTFYIGGSRVAPSGGETLPVISPVTERPFASIPDAGGADVDRAVAAARQAFDHGDWPRLAPQERAAVMVRLADEFEKRSEAIASTLTSEMGCPITVSRQAQVPGGIDLLRYYASLADSYTFEHRRPTYDAANSGLDVVVRKDPIGVVGAIVPWNGPYFTLMMKVGPALLAGCTMVIKPSPEASLSFAAFADAVEAAGVPPGVINIITGGAAAGRHLVTHPQVDKVAFTGSTEVGRRIAGMCAELLRPVTLELGGKSAAILLEDADVESAVDELLVWLLFAAGQCCVAPSRILAPRSRYDEIVDAVVSAMQRVPFGDPNDPSVVVGPLATAGQRDRVLGYYQRGVAEGAKVALGGGRPSDFGTGWYVEKTVFRDVDNSMTIAQEEIFGPACGITPYSDVDDAVRIANDSRFGLAGSVWTADVEHGYHVASRLRAGGLGVNNHRLDCASPIAGLRESGIGVERGVEAIDDYVETKGILVPR